MKFKYNGEYDDIINMSHHVSKKHSQMSLEARSAQFAPFAALTRIWWSSKRNGKINEWKKRISRRFENDFEWKNLRNPRKIKFKTRS